MLLFKKDYLSQIKDLDNYFNTSYVVVQGWWICRTDDNYQQFQYILCCCSRFLKKGWLLFQAYFNTSYVVVQEGIIVAVLSYFHVFQYILCCCSSSKLVKNLLTKDLFQYILCCCSSRATTKING